VSIITYLWSMTHDDQLTQSCEDRECCAEAYSRCYPLNDHNSTSAKDFTCKRSKCSVTVPKNCTSPENITSSITIGAVSWNLTGPPLNFSVPMASGSLRRVWTNGSRYNDQTPEHWMWFYGDNEVDLDMVKGNSRCVAVDRYAWGFSASLILTFCVYTFVYAVSLVALQTEVVLA
jgi:hypothetical protein